jgi:hypothetical protein
VLALFGALARAAGAEPSRPRIYISRCDGRTVVAPGSFEVICASPGGLLGTTFPSTAEHLVYRHYGSAVALATGSINACLLEPVQNLRLCPEGLLPPSEEAETSRDHMLAASFRFFDIVRCTHVDANGSLNRRSSIYDTWQLYYREFSYRFAGQPWNTQSIAPRNEIETSVQPTCRNVKLRKR